MGAHVASYGLGKKGLTSVQLRVRTIESSAGGRRWVNVTRYREANELVICGFAQHDCPVTKLHAGLWSWGKWPASEGGEESRVEKGPWWMQGSPALTMEGKIGKW